MSDAHDAAGSTGEPAADPHKVRAVFARLEVALRSVDLATIGPGRLRQTLNDTHGALAVYLHEHSDLVLWVGATALSCGDVEVWRDPDPKCNLSFRLFQSGIRQLRFNPSLPIEELVQLIFVLFDDRGGSFIVDDRLCRMWKCGLAHLSWWGPEDLVPYEDEEESSAREVVGEVVKHLFRQLGRDPEQMARLAGKDAPEREVIEALLTPADRARLRRAVEREEKEQLNEKMQAILFQLLERATPAAAADDLLHGFEQLLDAMLLAGDFAAVGHMYQRFSTAAARATIPETKQLVGLAARRFVERTGDARRLDAINELLRKREVRDIPGLRTYLCGLPPTSMPRICGMLAGAEHEANRRLLCDVLVQLGRDSEGLFAQYLQSPALETVRDFMHIIVASGFENGVQYLGPLLGHADPSLRLEALQLIGRDRSEAAFQLMNDALRSADPQLRAAALRLLAGYDPGRSVEVLIAFLEAEDFESRGHEEQVAAMVGLSLVNHPQAQAYVNEIFAQRPGFVGKKKVQARKLLVIAALSESPSVQVFQFLAAQAQDLANNSSEVAEAARASALKMRELLTAGGGAS